MTSMIRDSTFDEAHASMFNVILKYKFLLNLSSLCFREKRMYKRLF